MNAALLNAPELALLLHSCTPGAAASLSNVDRGHLDWGLFLSSAFRHRVAALAGRALSTAAFFEPDSRHEYVLDALLAAYTLNRHRNQVLISEAVRLLDLLHGSGIDVALRKGGYLAPAVYRDIGLRPMNDIDLFVDRRTATDAAALLMREGYVHGELDARGNVKPLSRRQSVFWNVHVNTLPTLHRPGSDPLLRSTAVDVCFNLFLPASGCDLPAGQLLGEAVTVDTDFGPIKAFRPEHLLLDVAVHLYKESTTLRYIERGKHQRLLQYVDIVSIVRAHPDLDWDRLVSTAGGAGASRNAYYALAGTEQLFPGTVPAPVTAGLATIGEIREDFLFEYGAIDLSQPLTWSASTVAERLFGDEPPAATSESPV